jgi:predicted dehydrogenase
MEYRYMPPITKLIAEAHSAQYTGEAVMFSIREHRYPFLTKVGDWNRFSRNTGGTLVEKCCHFFDLMRHVMQADPIRVYASGGQNHNHLDEAYAVGNQTLVPDILDNAYVVLDFANGRRALLDLCMFAENSIDNEHITVVGEAGKVESLLPSLTLRHGRREDWGVRKVWGEASGTGRGVSVRRVWDTGIKYAGQHFGASYIEHLRFAQAIRQGTPAEVTLEDGLRSVATGIAAHRSIDTGRAVALTEVLPGAL